LRKEYKHKVAELNKTYTGGYNSPAKDFGGNASINGKVPIRYISDYPSFLKPNKHYAYRRLNDSHVETTM
jgi:hypothetical protein